MTRPGSCRQQLSPAWPRRLLTANRVRRGALRFRFKMRRTLTGAAPQPMDMRFILVPGGHQKCQIYQGAKNKVKILKKLYFGKFSHRARRTTGKEKGLVKLCTPL